MRFCRQGLFNVCLAMVVAAFFSPAVFAQSYTGEPSNRVTITMGDTPWKFSKTDDFTTTPSAKDAGFSDNAWSNVGIPHCINASDTWLNNETGQKSMFTGTFWYRKRFTLDAAYAGRRIELEFQGVNVGCAVYVNGIFKPNIHKAPQPGQTTHVSGHLPFVVDITNDVTFGAQNVVAVRVRNNIWDGQFYTPAKLGEFAGFGMGFGGIHRPVYLHITDKVHVPLNIYSNIRRWGTYVGTTAATDASATVRLQTNVYNDDSQSKSVVVITKVVDAQNNVVATQTSPAQTINGNANYVFDQTATVSNPHLWYPNNNVNGKPYMYKVYHIVQAGGQTVDVFRSPLGIRVITWDKDFAYINGKKHIFWGFGSRYEYPGFGSAVPAEQQWRDVKLIAECGGSLLRPGHVPTTPVTVEACDAYGVCLFENTSDGEWDIWDHAYSLVYKDEFHRDCIIRDRNHPSIAVWELNNGACISGTKNTPGVIKRLCDTIPVYDYIAPRAASSRDGTDYYPIKPGILILGRLGFYTRPNTDLPCWGAESWPIANTRYSYDYEMPFTDRFVTETVEVRKTKGAGFAQWMFMECGGESYKAFLDASITADKRKTLGCSAVDHNRIPKLVYNVYKNALWVPYAIRPGVALQSHWNYSAGNRTVTAYSNCPSVELFVNNVSKGVRTPDTATTKCEWNLAWEAGTLRAVGRNASGTMVCFDERKTAGAPSKIVLTVEPAIVRPDDGTVFKIRANGTDAAFILATIVDAAGNWCPLATNNITFSTSGQGTYVGSSNYTVTLSKPDAYHAPGDTVLAAEGGMMKIAVRSTYTPGNVTVGASASELTSATPVTFQTYDITSPLVATRPSSIFSPAAARVRNATFKIAGTSFLIPREFSGKTVSIKMYDLSGKLLRSEVIKAKRGSLTRYGINASGTYILRCSEIQPADGK